MFNEIAGRIARIIRSEAASLISGRSEDVARVILANLAHGAFQMGPHQNELHEALKAAYSVLRESNGIICELSRGMAYHPPEVIAQVEAALAKARGEQPNAK